RNGKVLVRLLAMQRNRVVDRGRNALGLERRRKPVTPAAGKPEGILRPYRGRTERQVRNRRDVGEARRIAARDAFARHDLLGESPQFLHQYGRLDGVEPAVEPDAHAIVLAASLAVNAQAADHLRELLIVGEDRAAVAITAERLGRKETGC